MNDLEKAKELLVKEQLSLVIVNNGEIVYSSSDFGIKPMYTAVREYKHLLKGASVADKVIGRAAAMLLQYGEIKEVYTNLISKKAACISSNLLLKPLYRFSYFFCEP